MTDRLPAVRHNPKAPHVRRPMGDAVVSERDAFVERLRQLGAADDVLAAVVDNWDDPEWTERPTVIGMSDEALRAELVGIEREYAEGTTDPDDDSDEAAARLAVVDAQAAEIITENVPVVVSFIKEDPLPPQRAIAVEALESQAEAPRKGVLDATAAAIADGEA